MEYALAYKVATGHVGREPTVVAATDSPYSCFLDRSGSHYGFSSNPGFPVRSFPLLHLSTSRHHNKAAVAPGKTDLFISALSTLTSSP